MKGQMRKLTLTVCFLFLLELVLGGPGHWLVISGISLRKLLFSGSLISLYLYVTLEGFWRFRLQDILVFLFLFFSLTIWVVAVPYRNDILPEWSFQDGSALLLLLIYFPLAQLIRFSKIDWSKVKSVFVFLVAIISLVQLTIWLTVFLFPDLGWPIRRYSLMIFDPLNIVKGNPSIFIGWMPDGFFRVMWITSLFILPAFFFVIGKEKKRKFDYLLIILLLGGLYVSYTRAFWLGLVTGLFTLALLRTTEKLIKFKIAIRQLHLLVGGLLIMAVIVMGVFNVENLLNNQIVDRLKSLSVDEGTQIRIAQVGSLLKKWSNFPIWGTGFGGSADYVRSEAAPFSYEMVAFALLMKLGLLGASIWGVIAVLIAFFTWNKACHINESKWFYWWISTCLAYFIVAMTNPYFINFIGISIMVLIILEVDHKLFRQNRLRYEK